MTERGNEDFAQDTPRTLSKGVREIGKPAAAWLLSSCLTWVLISCDGCLLKVLLQVGYRSQIRRTLVLAFFLSYRRSLTQLSLDLSSYTLPPKCWFLSQLDRLLVAITVHSEVQELKT